MLCVVSVMIVMVISVNVGAHDKLKNFCATHVFIHKRIDYFDLEKQ
jgi:hypothetical protein